MYNETVDNLLAKLKQAETSLTTGFGVDKPEKLASISFQKRFIKARTKLNQELIYGKNPAITKAVEVMLRGYEALKQELEKNNIKPIPKEAWLLTHEKTNQEVLVCKTNEQKLNVKKHYEDKYVIYSAEELLNLVEQSIFEFKQQLTHEGLTPSITKYEVKNESPSQ